MKKISKKVLAAALVLTLAVPSAVSFAADEEAPAELPEPLTWITMQDDNLERNGYQDVTGTEVVKDDKMGTVLHVNASTEAEGVFTDSEASFTNPLVGQDFSEIDVLQLNEVLQAQNEEKKANGEAAFLDDNGNPIWTKGVMINYWIKVTGTDNGVVLNFRNKNRLQYDKDEQAIADEKAGNAVDKRFALGDQTIYVDDAGNEYTVYSSIGDFAAWRSDFAENACKKSSSGTIKARPKDGGDEATLVPVAKEYEHYSVMDYEENQQSQVKYGLADGFLQTALDGGVAFTEDRTNDKDENGLINEDHPQLNPNKLGEFKYRAYNGQNKLGWSGTLDGVSDFMDFAYEENPDTANWHMITVQIQNDSISYFIDGRSGEELYGGMAAFYSNGKPFSESGVGKNFNAGWGYKSYDNDEIGRVYVGAGGRKEWYGNAAGSLMLDWLSMEGTTFSIGGTNLEDIPATFTAAAYYNTERVAEFYIDDIAFYGELLSADQLLQLYDNGVEKMKLENPDDADPPEPIETTGNGDVDGEEGITSSDALEVLKFAAKLEEPTAEQRAAADTNLDGNIDAEDALNILKLAAKLIEALPVPKQ